MNTLNQTEVFTAWLARLNDRTAHRRIVARIRLAENGNFGDHHGVGEGIHEMRIDYGPGYRAYYAQQGNMVYILLCGGDKGSQSRDIMNAKAMWKQMKKEK